MKLWGLVIVVIGLIAVLIVAAFYVSGAFSNVVEQPGDDPVIAYIHPSATIRIDNRAVLSEEFIESIVNARVVVDQVAPQSVEFFSAFNTKTGNVKVVFTINGVGTFDEVYQYSVGPLQFKDYSAEPIKAFGMKVHGSYTVTIQLIDLPTNEIRDTYVVVAVV
jgi:hypothetical protein